VLLRRLADARIAPAVAPGNPWVGLFLPYTPLHRLLHAELDRPLVLTSANRSDEPIAAADDEAIERLAGIADRFLAHDREIENRIDDSVARVIAGRPVVLRRARGYVPRPVRVARSFVRPILATGAHLKNAVCLADGDSAWLGPHLGDLETLAACEAFEEVIPRLVRFLGIEPEVVAHDLHPDYFSTRWARSSGLTPIAVQHHHAHVASLMAERSLEGPVLALAWDGVGLGSDGAAWGGELLLATRGTFRRVGTLRPVRMAGGDRAVREIWRLALAALDDAFEGAPPLERIPLLRGLDERRLGTVRRMLTAGVHAPAAHGVGRWFDVFAAIGTGRRETRYEGQAALEWNALADPAERRPYPYAIDDTMEVWQLDLRPAVRAAVDDLVGGRSVPTISGRFHATLAEGGAEMVRRALFRHGGRPVLLTGGCFQNALLAERLVERLAPVAPVHWHGEVPPGDGGLALGQAIVADARLRGEGDEPCA
jgi:hydrogenase maturation protein HypF